MSNPYTARWINEYNRSREESAIRGLWWALMICLLIVSSFACGGTLAGGTVAPAPPKPAVPPPAAAATVAVDLVACREQPADNDCAGPAAAVFRVHVSDEPPSYLEEHGDGNGYVYATDVPSALHATDITISAPGFVTQVVNTTIDTLLAENVAGRHNFFVLAPAHVDPSGIPLGELAAIRGAMWALTGGACGNLSIGPRPGQPDNVIGTVFITDYSLTEQDCIIGELKARGYTHVVMGPLVDSDGYHGVWTPNDWRGASFDRFLDAIQKFYDAGLKVVVFGKPDGWTLDQLKTAFTPLLQQPRAQRLIRIFVPNGWEPARYAQSSCTWAAFGQWARTTLPNALILMHTESDLDAPAGSDGLCNDDDHTWNPAGNAGAWARVAPFYHGWLTQSGAFNDPTGTGGDREHPELTNFQNWQRQFDPAVRGSYRDRFEHGYAGWPTGSAWGVNQPLRVYAGEYSAYWKFWQHRTEAEGVTWGNAAIAAGAAGYLDSGSVPVPVRP